MSSLIYSNFSIEIELIINTDNETVFHKYLISRKIRHYVQLYKKKIIHGQKGRKLGKVLL